MDNVSEKTLSQERIKMERCYDDHLKSYCVDVK